MPITASRPALDVLMTTMDAGGHAGPTLSVARSLLERGHRVRVLADPVFAAAVAAAGAEWVSWERAPHRRPDDPPKPAEVLSPFQAFARARDELICGPAGRFAADVRAEVARRRPDVVVADTMLPGAVIGAEAEGLPVAALSMTLMAVPGWGVPPAGMGFRPLRGPLGRVRDGLGHAVAARLWATGLPALNRARVEHGLAPVPRAWDQLLHADEVLICSSAALEYPGARLPERVAFVGPRVDDTTFEGAWEEPTGDGPLVLVSLSSDQMGQEPVLRRIVAGLGAVDARVLVTTGPCVDPASIPAPPNVHVVASAPHVEVLRRADAVVTHGGHGTVAKALALGVPIVCVPLGRDQHDIAARVAFAGAGVTVGAKARPQRYAAAVRRVLDDPRHRAAASRVGLRIADERRRDLAVERIEALARVEVA